MSVPWLPEVDTRRQFRAAVELAIDRNSDAVVHTGDLLDSFLNSEDLAFVKDLLVRLRDHGIPVHVLVGNHDFHTEPVLDRLTDWAEEGLLTVCSRDGEPLDDAVDLYGVPFGDIDPGDAEPTVEVGWWKRDQRFGSPATTGPNVLCLHDIVDPPVRSSVARVDLGTLLEASNLSFDLVLAGHIHVPSSGAYAGVPIQYAGPTARISEYFSDSDPCVNLVQVYEDGHVETSISSLP